MRLLIISIFFVVFASCGQSTTNEQNRTKQEYQQTEQKPTFKRLIPIPPDSTAILQARVLDIYKSPYVYTWGTFSYSICFLPVKPFNGAFNEDTFAVAYKTLGTLDSTHQVFFDSIPFTTNKEYVLKLNLLNVDSGAYPLNNKLVFFYFYHLSRFIDAESPDIGGKISKW